MTTGQTIRNYIAKKKISERQFAANVGVRAEQLNKWINDKAKPTLRNIEKVKSVYPDFNYTTNDNTDSTEQPDHSKEIPYYDIDATAGDISVFSDNSEKPTSYFNIPAFADCSFGMNVYGHSMYPKITNGDIILCREIELRDFFNYGEIYLIITKEQRLIKYIKRHDDKTYLRLESENKEFDTIDLPIKSILKLYLVKGTIKRNQI